MERLQLDVRTIAVTKEYAGDAATAAKADAALAAIDAPATVRGTALTGLSVATATPVVPTDTVLTGVGKLQAQLDGKLDVDGYPAKATLTGAESIPLVDGVKEAITPDQLADYIRFQRKQVLVSLGTISNNQTAIGSFEMPAGFTIRTIETSASMRVRLYQSAAARDADLNRALGMDRPQGSAMFLEFYSVNGLLGAVLSPVVDGFTTEGELYYSVQNKSLVDQAMTMTFTYLPTEI